MLISANLLRNARREARLTQADLADILEVSPRTVVNWEREGAGVPARSAPAVSRVLNLVQMPDGSWRRESQAVYEREPNDFQRSGKNLKVDVPGRTEDEVREALAEVINSRATAIKQLPRVENEPKLALKIADLIIESSGAIDAAEIAVDLKVHPTVVAALVEAVTNLVIESGLIGLGGPPSEAAINNIIVRGGAIVNRSVDEWVPDGHKPFLTRIDVEDRLQAKREEMAASTQSEQNVGGLNEDAGIPENVEEVWGLAAHPKTDAPEDHTP